MDDTVKLWDIRKLAGGVVKTFSDVPTHLVSEPLSMLKVATADPAMRSKLHPEPILKDCREFSPN